jgi:predicted enzyme related to lactoylglutathione lyase
MAIYSYEVATAFPNGRVLLDTFQPEVQAVVPGLSYIGTAEGICSLHFDADLTAEQKTTLDGVVAAHQGYTIVPTFLVSDKTIGSEVAITSATDWQILGGVVTNAAFFCPVARCYGEVLGSATASGTGAEVRVVEDNGQSSQVVAGPVAIPDGGWATLRFNSWGNLIRSGPCTYSIQARLNGAASASMRYTSISLFDINVIQGGV